MAFSPVRRFVVDSSKIISGFSALLFAGVVVVLSGCHPAVTDPNDPKFIVAEKAPWQITEGDLDAEVADYLKQHQATAEQVGPSKMPMLKTAMLKNMVLKKILLGKAAALQLKDDDLDKAVNAQIDQIKGAAGDEEFQTQLKTAGITLDDLKKRMREKVEIEKVLDAEAFKNVDPTEQEVDAIYMQHKDSFVIPEKVRASRILIMVDDKTSPADKAAKKKAIDKAHDRVAKGEDFSKVATEVSEDKYSAPRGGDINYFQKGENEPGFDDVAFNTKVNTVSPVFQTQLGYQFIKVTAIQPAGVIPVAQARSFITSKLREMKMSQQEQAYAKTLLDNSGVTYHMLLIDPPADMSSTPNGQGAPDNAPPPSDSSAPSAPPAGPDAAPAPAPTTEAAPAAPASTPEPTPAPASAPPSK
jgi:peptidyl-prolyl cis-trans isomerase C